MRPGVILTALARGRFPQLLLVSGAAWVMVVMSEHGVLLPALCHTAGGSWLTQSSHGIAAAFVANPPSGLILPWLVMLLAMMPPLLSQQIAHLWDRSFARRRLRAVALFVIGYGAIWMAAGIALTMAAIAISEISQTVSLPAVVAGVALTLLWHCSPPKQICLNRCHSLPTLSAFGIAADLDCLRYGLVAAIWCFGTCWALMLVPLVAPGLHVATMALVSVLAFAERLRPPRPARWRSPVRPGDIAPLEFLRPKHSDDLDAAMN